MAESLELRAIAMQREVGGSNHLLQRPAGPARAQLAARSAAEGAETTRTGRAGGAAASPLPMRRRPWRFSCGGAPYCLTSSQDARCIPSPCAGVRARGAGGRRCGQGRGAHPLPRHYSGCGAAGAPQGLHAGPPGQQPPAKHARGEGWGGGGISACIWPGDWLC